MTLKSIQIKNLILVESLNVSFEKGFNVLSGETGSGKSALLSALQLCMGERAETSLIRHGEEKSTIEALFDIEKLQEVKKILEMSGIDFDIEEELIIKREISTSGKSRAFVNNQAVQLQVLKKLGASLLSMVQQHENQSLFSEDNHLKILDLYAELEDELKSFKNSFEEEKEKSKKLNKWLDEEGKRVREIDRLKVELEEIKNAYLKEDEEEELFKEYTLLNSQDELVRYTDNILQGLSGSKTAILSTLNSCKEDFEKLTKVDVSLKTTLESFKQAHLELQDIHHTLRNYHSKLEYQPERLFEIDERLKWIDRLKKRYGKTLKEIKETEKSMLQQLQELENRDIEVENLKEELIVLKQKNDLLASEISKKRKQAALKFQTLITKELQQLNMDKAEFICKISDKTRLETGDDFVEFYIKPNVGESYISVKECASGGELSRLLLSIHTLLAGKDKIPTLIFDEIDANIGGKTASYIGEKLKKIGEKQQLLCVTHFPQVAEKAHHHIQIFKKEEKGRTKTFVQSLDESSRQKELLRMKGEA